MRKRQHKALFLASIIAASTAIAACGGSSGTESTLAPVTEAPSTTAAASTTTTEAAPGVPTLAPGAPLPSLVPFTKADAKKSEPEVVVGTITIPAIELNEMKMYLGYSDPTYDKGVGLWPGAPKPGEAGNVVLGGHRTSGPRPFRRVDELKAGDEVIVTTADGKFVYVVEGVAIYPASEAADVVLAQTSSAKMTMFACHPPGKVTHRIVVFTNYSRKAAV
jgi:sortase A